VERFQIIFYICVVVLWYLILDARKTVEVFIGVRGGESEGAVAPPGLKNFRANSVFRASASCPKISE